MQSRLFKVSELQQFPILLEWKREAGRVGGGGINMSMTMNGYHAELLSGLETTNTKP